MAAGLQTSDTHFKQTRIFTTACIILGMVAFFVAFILLDNAYYKFSAARFPSVGESTGLATLWGVVSRAHILIFMIPLVIWKPRLLGFQVGKMRQHWKILLIMLIANCGIIAAYLWLTHSSTPYSNNQWFLTEVVTVPLVEETFWRGIVFAILLFFWQKVLSRNSSIRLVAWLSGLAFGLMHVKNIVAGVPISFVALQSLNAVIWGVVYGYARAKTESIYPSIILHAAMNLIVILF